MLILRELKLSPKARDCLGYNGRAGTLQVLAERSDIPPPSCTAQHILCPCWAQLCFNSALCAPTAFTHNTLKLCVCRDARSESNVLFNPPKAPLCVCARPLDSFQISWALWDGEKVPMALLCHTAILLCLCAGCSSANAMQNWPLKESSSQRWKRFYLNELVDKDKQKSLSGVH